MLPPLSYPRTAVCNTFCFLCRDQPFATNLIHIYVRANRLDISDVIVKSVNWVDACTSLVGLKSNRATTLLAFRFESGTYEAEYVLAMTWYCAVSETFRIRLSLNAVHVAIRPAAGQRFK